MKTKLNLYVQHNGNDVLAKDIEAKVKDFCKEKGLLMKDIQTLDIYYVPDKDAIYAAATNKDGKVEELVVSE